MERLHAKPDFNSTTGETMQLKSIFAKPVDRAIEGVIKADDEASLRLELEEYVLTNEVEKRLESFLEAYNTYQNANVSSHFRKSRG
jgi:hypothetical protein